VRRLAWLGALALVAYSGLVEPRLLTVREHRLHLQTPAKLPPLRLALVADVHAGLFVRGWQIERLVDRLNALDVDAVVVAGDWTYDPPRDLHALLQPFSRLRHPVWGVLGNHDTGAPGPPLAQALRQALQDHGVQVLDGRRLQFQGWDVMGLSDLWGGEPRGEMARLLPPGTPTAPRLVLAHQPDTAALLPAGSASLVVSGHTHGGQIMLPWVTRQLVLPGMSAQGWFEGLYTTQAGPLFVTGGIGTIGLPARLAVVPRIDVLRLE
jgi:predicted MPP superfamily phosphohydrolase